MIVNTLKGRSIAIHILNILTTCLCVKILRLTHKPTFFTVVIDYPGNSKSPTGKFECIYRQPMSIPRYGSAADLVVRGFSLPLDYFYRGKIEIKESYDDADIGKERDVKVILNKLKQLYDDTDIMVEPEDDYDSNRKTEQETYTHSTESEYELSVGVTVITGQLEELMDRIISEQSGSSNSKSILKQDSLDSPNAMSPEQSVKSVTDIKSLIKKSCNRFTSSEAISSERSFKFSNLDDGPFGKGSNVEFRTIKKALQQDISPAIEIQQDKISSRSKNKNNILQATSNIISFINEKEKEYFSR